MQGYLKRLATSGAAYQASSLVSGFLALFTLPLYTHHLTKAQLGYAETLLTAIILASIVLRFGVGEAFVRFYFDDDDGERRETVGDEPRQPPVDAVRHAPGPERDDARRAQEVLGLVAQDEALERGG